MNYLIAVLSDRLQAKEAYTRLTQANIPTSQISIKPTNKGLFEFFYDLKNCIIVLT